MTLAAFFFGLRELANTLKHLKKDVILQLKAISTPGIGRFGRS